MKTKSSVPPAPTVALAEETQKGIEVVAVRAGLDQVGLGATRELV